MRFRLGVEYISEEPTGNYVVHTRGYAKVETMKKFLAKYLGVPVEFLVNVRNGRGIQDPKDYAHVFAVIEPIGESYA